MKRSMVKSQISNFKTLEMCKRQMISLAENVFQFKNLPKFIDQSYMKRCLVSKGAIAFFYDDVLNEFLALPFSNLGYVDVYGRPTKIQVYAENGYTRSLKPDEYVIMYDNNARYALIRDILQYAERKAQCMRTSDINLAHQKTPRFWKTSKEHEKSVRDMINNVDSADESVITYEDINLDDTTLCLNPAPYVIDKIDDHEQKIWNEFLRLIGISNVNFEKKERNIKDEVLVSQGGTIASRFQRFEPRKKAVEEINEKWGLNIEVEYYDGLPTTIIDESNEESEVESNDI